MLKLCLFGIFASISLYGIEGTYVGSGMDPYGKDTYTVTATFTKDKNDVYQATWDELQNGKKVHYEGTGLKQNDSICFIYQNTNDTSDKGLQVYKIKENVLEGRFVAFADNLVGEEKLSRSKK